MRSVLVMFITILSRYKVKDLDKIEEECTIPLCALFFVINQPGESNNWKKCSRILLVPLRERFLRCAHPSQEIHWPEN